MEIYILLSEGKESCDVVCVSTDLMDIRLAIKQVLESPNYPTLQIWENGKMKTWLAGDDVLHKIQIPFSALYDIRQYDKCMNGCYMEIKKI